MLAVMREEGLGKVTTGAETAPEEVGETASGSQKRQYAKALGE